MKHTIVLFYKYTPIENPEELMESQRALCENLGLTGRLLIAKEGINGTFEGTTESIETYCKDLLSDPRFADIDMKTSEGTGDAFPKLRIRVRPEIVTTRLDENIDPTKDTGTYLEPEELQEWFEQDKDFTIIDMRNDYEYECGYFDKSVRAGMKNFRDIVNVPKNHADLKNKTVVTCCTGGVRCEKASAYLKQQGFTDVYQVKGGMHRYMEKFPGKNFNGTLYVFDGRITTDLDAKERKVVGKCITCNAPSEEYTNCSYLPCHLQIIQCSSCGEEQEPFCSEACKIESKKNVVA